MTLQTLEEKYIKHLPGQHRQLNHAGTHMRSGISPELVESDEKTSQDFLDRTVALTDDQIGLASIHYDRRQYNDNRLANDPQVREVDDVVLAGADLVQNAPRYYRGISLRMFKDLMRTGEIQVTADDQPGPDAPTEGDTDFLLSDVSVTIRPSHAKRFGDYVLVLDGNAVRQQGSRPNNIAVRMAERVASRSDPTLGNIEELEARTWRNIPDSAILGVITPSGEILDLKKKLTQKHLPGIHDQQAHAGDRSAAQSVSAKFDIKEWEAKPVPDRIAQFNALSPDAKDALADAKHSVAKIQAERLTFAGKRPETGSPTDASKARLSQIGDFITGDASKRIQTAMVSLSQNLKDSGVDDNLVRNIILEVVDSLAVQENESLGRTLGDHGVRHSLSNAHMALNILNQVPGQDTPQSKAAVTLAAVFHDTGYTTEPAQIFLDSEHPRWSAQHYENNLQPMISNALGAETASKIKSMIETHADTTIDWKNDPVSSALRVADNVSLFKAEKLPGLFHYVPSAIPVLERLGKQEVSIDDAKKEILSQVASSRLSPKIKTALSRSAKEMNLTTPKFTLGMLGGQIKNFTWSKQANTLDVNIVRNETARRLQKELDLGQRQFKKFAETYKIDPAKFETDSEFVFPPEGSPTALRAFVTGAALKSLIERLEDKYEKHLPGIHLQRRHGRPENNVASLFLDEELANMPAKLGRALSEYDFEIVPMEQGQGGSAGVGKVIYLARKSKGLAIHEVAHRVEIDTLQGNGPWGDKIEAFEKGIKEAAHADNAASNNPLWGKDVLQQPEEIFASASEFMYTPGSSYLLLESPRVKDVVESFWEVQENLPGKLEELEEKYEKHLPGVHDQQKHAGEGGKGGVPLNVDNAPQVPILRALGIIPVGFVNDVLLPRTGRAMIAYCKARPYRVKEIEDKLPDFGFRVEPPGFSSPYRTYLKPSNHDPAVKIIVRTDPFNEGILDISVETEPTKQGPKGSGITGVEAGTSKKWKEGSQAAWQELYGYLGADITNYRVALEAEIVKHLPGLHAQNRHAGEARGVKPISDWNGAVIGKEIYRGKRLWNDGSTTVYEIVSVDSTKDVEKALDKGSDPQSGETASKFVYDLAEGKLYGTSTGIHTDIRMAARIRPGNDVDMTFSDGKWQFYTSVAGPIRTYPEGNELIRRQNIRQAVEIIGLVRSKLVNLGFPAHMLYEVVSADRYDKEEEDSGFLGKSKVKTDISPDHLFRMA